MRRFVIATILFAASPAFATETTVVPNATIGAISACFADQSAKAAALAGEMQLRIQAEMKVAELTKQLEAAKAPLAP